MGRQQRPSRSNEIKQIDKKKPSVAYRVEVLYKDINFAVPRLRYNTNPIQGAFTYANMPIPRLSFSKEFTFMFTQEGIVSYMPILKDWLTRVEDGEQNYSSCTIYLYEITKFSKIVYRDINQVVMTGKFRRKEHVVSCIAL